MVLNSPAQHRPTMTTDATTALPRSTQWLLTLVAALLLLTLMWDAAGLDLPAMLQIGTPQGFALRHQHLLEQVLHDGVRKVSTVMFIVLALWALRPDRHPSTGGPSRRERLTVLALVTLSLLAISLAKYLSRSSCPWEWSNFGGRAVYTSHWNLLMSDGGGGRCFPGGHASGSLAFFALCLPWLWSPSAARRAQVGWGWFGLVVLAGLVSGITQTLRGAHPPSHTLWTGVICAAVALGGWALALPTLRAAQVTAEPASPGRS